MRLLVIGGSGQAGTALRTLTTGTPIEVATPTRAEIDMLALDGIEAAERLQWRTHPMHYNLLLAQLQSNQHNQAGAWLESHPWLVDPTELATSAPFLRPVLATIRQRQGRDTEAAALLVDDEAAFAAGAYERLGPVQANRAWLIAGIELAPSEALNLRLAFPDSAFHYRWSDTQSLSGITRMVSTPASAS